jgi:GNAT superfamily N-acetyltransferase
MQPATKYEIRESNRHLCCAWQLYARASSQGEALDTDGVSFANAGQPWFFMNVAALNGAAGDRTDLWRRTQRAVSYFEGRSNPWILTGSEDWFGDGATDILSGAHLAHKLDMTGMAAERLSPPARPLPDAELRRIDDEESRFALADLNAASYGVASEWARQAIGGAALWQAAIFGTVAYVRGEPASGAFALPIDDALYIAWVATAQAHRRQGLAELVIRRCLEDARRATGLERTVLHATDDGRPVYLRMGYRCVVKFPVYAPASHRGGEP